MHRLAVACVVLAVAAGAALLRTACSPAFEGTSSDLEAAREGPQRPPAVLAARAARRGPVKPSEEVSASGPAAEATDAASGDAPAVARYDGPLHVLGHVLAPSGTSFDGASVVVEGTATPIETFDVSIAPEGLPPSSHTGEHGAFRTDWPRRPGGAPSSLDVSVGAVGFFSRTLTLALPPADNEAQATIALARSTPRSSGSICLHITGGGRSVFDVKGGTTMHVVARQPGHRSAAIERQKSVPTAEASLTIDGLEPGRWEIETTPAHDEHLRETCSVIVTAGTNTEAWCRFPPIGSVKDAGVRWRDGVGCDALIACSDDGTLLRARPGMYTLLPAGAWDVSLEDEDGAIHGPVRVVVTQGSTTTADYAER
jgi:hypothetical protein